MKQKILVIDDESEIGLLLSIVASRNGYEAKYSLDLASGAKLLKDYEPDILFLDINLPDGNGLDCIRHFKEQNSNLKIIMISAIDTLVNKQKAIKEGANEFMAKPFDIKQLNTILHKYKNGTY
ncbi:MAG: response regulator [Fimbriimonadaceae bacterium]|nr:response regulator [Chitinophagales bacterium]